MFKWGLQQRAVQVILLIGIYLLVANYLPQVVHQGLYTLSLFIKDLLIWMLPITVGLFIAHTICSFEKRALTFVIAILFFEAISNLCSVWYAYGCGHLAVHFLPPVAISATPYEFAPLWRLPFVKPDWWAADKGTLLGLVLGCIAAMASLPRLKQVIEQSKEKAQWVLTNVFARMIPIFVLGFVVRMHQTDLFNNIIAHYAVLLVWLVLFLALYMMGLFLLGSGGSFKKALRSLRNLLPAGGIAFTSGCSLSTMPWTIEGTGKNLDDPNFAKGVIPATTNIQQIGDCIINTFLCFLIYTHFFGQRPDFMTWMSFSVVFVLARFATAAVIGGAIFIMLPVYETYLSFNAEMLAIILGFNVILDPLVTSSNVIANGALCRIFEKVWKFLIQSRPVVEPKKDPVN